MLFVLFHDYYSLHMFACMDTSLQNVCTASLAIPHTAYHIPGSKQSTSLR